MKDSLDEDEEKEEESEGKTPQSPQMEESGQNDRYKRIAGTTFEEDLK